ncbi:DUF2938 domain-containing protein [Sinimarinibacterium sp. CAU 1509]|uniref:DUF2938 domain-containing protein n=1 Tax=Sinimarinibacterium sp. CAU 1509 TaxID=2562283 RepID=UPI0010AC4FE5|nr:DUF2938 domain-containing protein [Sinimarinibacterium sp. CAU 1509]TJY58891.1 DUF2938 domain-containing protein [Sinimarinibacterium sp. CAU 1509]
MDALQLSATAVLVGVLATAVMDVGSVLLKQLVGVPMPNYVMVGRWVGHMPAGRFRHRAIAAAAPVRGERWIGWAVHYTTGVVFAALLLLIWGDAWIANPTFAPALIVGLGSVAAPFLLMQPAMGAGIAARKTPDPVTARRRSLINHSLFGLGLYVSGWAVHLLYAA